nr:transposase [Streptomyces sp. WAC 04229]
MRGFCSLGCTVCRCLLPAQLADHRATVRSERAVRPQGCTVALSQHDLLRLLESLRSADGLELVREVAERLLQELIEAEATTKIGAEWGEHTDTRTTWRNGHREKTMTTQAGDLELAIPKLRAHRRRPGLPQPTRRPPPGHRGPRRTPRRVDHLPPLPLQREHGRPLPRCPNRPTRHVRRLIAYTTTGDMTTARPLPPHERRTERIRTANEMRCRRLNVLRRHPVRYRRHRVRE